MRKIVENLDNLLYQAASEKLRLTRIVSRLNIEGNLLSKFLEHYKKDGSIREIEERICPHCDQTIEANDGTDEYFCDLCHQTFTLCELDPETSYKVELPPLVHKLKEPIIELEVKNPMPVTASDLQLNHITPWAGLSHEEFMVETSTLDDITSQNILKKLEKYGICLVRITAQTADEYVITNLAKFIGPPMERQNQYAGTVKRIRPESGGLANSGDTTKDLGFHVDGTQHEYQPALLLFQYITEAKIGANSIFVDTAKVLLDIEETRRNQILTNLARYDAGQFVKRGMNYTGPIFSLSPAEKVICRIRFDDVIKLHPTCHEDFEYLKSRFDDTSNHCVFRPREGDIILFDNWRVLHARDEVYGQRIREHNRMWISNLKPELQSTYYLGVRPVPLETLAQIKQMNKMPVS